MGFKNGLYAFTAAVLGGIGNIPGAVLGGLVIGLVRSLASGYVGERWTDADHLRILIVILVFRPVGAVGRAHEGESMSTIGKRYVAALGSARSGRAGVVSAAVALSGKCFPDRAGSRFGSIGDQLTYIFIYAILALGLNVVVGYTGLVAPWASRRSLASARTSRASSPSPVSVSGRLHRGAGALDSGRGPAGGAARRPDAAAARRLSGDRHAWVSAKSCESRCATWKKSPAGTRGLNPVPPPQLPRAGSRRWRRSASARLEPRLSAVLLSGAGLLLVVIVLLRNLETLAAGPALGWRIREDELAATCMGINAARVKLSAFAVGAGLAGMAGCLYATKLQSTADPKPSTSTARSSCSAA